MIHKSNHTGRILSCPLFYDDSNDYPLILWLLEKNALHDKYGNLVTANSLIGALREYTVSTGRTLSEVVTKALESFLRGIHGRG